MANVYSLQRLGRLAVFATNLILVSGASTKPALEMIHQRFSEHPGFWPTLSDWYNFTIGTKAT